MISIHTLFHVLILYIHYSSAKEVYDANDVMPNLTKFEVSSWHYISTSLLFEN